MIYRMFDLRSPPHYHPIRASWRIHVSIVAVATAASAAALHHHHPVTSCRRIQNYLTTTAKSYRRLDI